MSLTFAASGDITVTLPAGTGYIGTAPDFKIGETWELSFRDKIDVYKRQPEQIADMEREDEEQEIE